MLTAILSFLTGGGLRAIMAEIRQIEQQRLVAANDETRLELDAKIAALRTHADEIKAARNNRLIRLVQAAFALPFLVYVYKLVIWDKVLGLGTTDGLSPELWQTYWIVLGGFFVLEWRIKR